MITVEFENNSYYKDKAIDVILDMIAFEPPDKALEILLEDKIKIDYFNTIELVDARREDTCDPVYVFKFIKEDLSKKVKK